MDGKELLKSEKTEISSEKILELINFEISEIRSRWAGRSTWALYLALASIFWIFLKQVEDVYRWSDVLLCLIPISFSIDLISHIFPKNKRALNKGRYFAVGSVPEISGIQIVLQIFKIGLTILLLFKFKMVISPFVFWPGICFETIVGLALLLFSFLKYVTFEVAVPATATESKSKMTVCILVIMLTFLIVCFFGSLYEIFKLPWIIAEFQTATLMGGFFLALYFLASEHFSPMLNSLLNTKREFLFGRITNEMALERVDVAILGLKINDIFRPEMEKLLKAIAVSQENLHRAEAQLEAMNAYAQRDLTEVDGPILQKLLDTLKLILNKFTSDVDQVNDELDRLHRKSLLFSKIDPSSNDAIKDLLNIVTTDLLKLISSQKNISEGFTLFEQRVEKAYKTRIDCLQVDVKKLKDEVVLLEK